MPAIEFETTIFPDGRIEVGPIQPKDFDLIGDKLISMMRAVGDGNVVVVTECISPEQREAMAQRLAALLLRGAA